MIIYGKKVLLRGIEQEDIEMLRETINDPETEYMTTGWHFPLSRTDQQRWFEDYRQNNTNQRWVIETIETHEAIGLIALTDIDWKNREAWYSYKLKPSGPKRLGYGTDAMMALLQYSFEELGMHRISGTVIEYNTASIHLSEKFGAKREGLKRQAIYKRGAWHDVICYGVLYEDYLEAKKRLNW